jgi:hypothetical protein
MVRKQPSSSEVLERHAKTRSGLMISYISSISLIALKTSQLTTVSIVSGNKPLTAMTVFGETPKRGIRCLLVIANTAKFKCAEINDLGVEGAIAF